MFLWHLSVSAGGGRGEGLVGWEDSWLVSGLESLGRAWNLDSSLDLMGPVEG